MSTVIRSLFSADKSKQKDQQIATSLSKIQGLVRDLQRQKHHDLSNKVKAILNIALKEQSGYSLFEKVYRSAMYQSYVQWVPILQKSVKLLSSNSAFMKVVFQMQDYKILIERRFIPSYLETNNLLNQKNGYLNISYSSIGMVVPLLDYVFIRLLHGIKQLNFIEKQAQNDKQYELDDVYTYLSRNPYFLLLNNYLQSSYFSQKTMKRLTSNIKMFFVDEIIIKHRINRSFSQSRTFNLFGSEAKIQVSHFLVIFLLLKQSSMYFEEKDLYLFQVIQRFGSLIARQRQTFFRVFLRLFIYAYSRGSIQNQVIDQLSKANQKDGCFQLERYSTQSFNRSVKMVQKNQKTQFDRNKILLLKLLQKDQYTFKGSNIHFNLIRTIGCFLILQIKMNQLQSRTLARSSIQKQHKKDNQANCLEVMIIKIHRFANRLQKSLKHKKDINFNQNNLQSFKKQVEELDNLFFKAYGRNIDRKRLEDLKDDSINRSFNIRGQYTDYTFSIETYKKDVQQNCWKVPLKQSQYKILYDFFYWVARKVDVVIPGHKNRKQPYLPLRYFSNPFVSMITMILLLLIIKIIF